MAHAENSGRFVWYDLMTSEPAAAEEFYTKLVGWGTQPWEGGDAPYTMWTNQETPLGGVMEMPQEVSESGVPPQPATNATSSSVSRVETGRVPSRSARPILRCYSFIILRVILLLNVLRCRLCRSFTLRPGDLYPLNRTRSYPSHCDISDRMTMSPGCSPSVISISFTELFPSWTLTRSA